MSQFAYNTLMDPGHNYNKIDYQKSRQDEEKDYASYAAIIEYSQMQEKLLINLRHELEKIRGADNLNAQLITPSYTNNPLQSASPSLAAFKNAAVAARKLPSMNSRNKHGKQATPTILNPKRDYPRPWALDQSPNTASVLNSNANNFNTLDTSAFRQQCKVDRGHNPQKKYYSSTMERHHPININCGLCQNCQHPLLSTDYFGEDEQSAHFGQFSNQDQQLIPVLKGQMVPSERLSSARQWNNNFYVTEELLNATANSQFNTVVFPDPQAKKHPYLMKILEKTIPGNLNAYNAVKSMGPIRTQKQLKAPKGPAVGMAGPVKVFNRFDVLTEERSSKQQMFPSWGSSKVMKSRPSVSVGVEVEESIQGGRKQKVMTKMNSSVSIGQGEREEEMTLLPPRCILSSLSPAWSQGSVQKGQLKHQIGTSTSESGSGSEFAKKSYVTVKGKGEKDSVGAERAVTYQVFTDNKKVLSEWEGIDPESQTENKTEKRDTAQRKEKSKSSRRKNNQSSGDESYGSMKVIRDSKEDLEKRIYEDFQSFEDFNPEAGENEVEKPVTPKKVKRDCETPTVIKTEPRPSVVKAKDSRSLIRNQRLSKIYKKKVGRNDSMESSRNQSALKLPVMKKSVSWTGIQSEKSLFDAKAENTANWPPYVVDKMFPEVEKVLQEARCLSPYVDNLDKMMQSPPDLDKMLDDKIPWISSKLTRFPTWFRDVDPITKLGENLTIDKVFQIDIKPGQFKCQPLEEFVADSMGVFKGSSTVCTHEGVGRVSATGVRKTTSQLVAEVKMGEHSEGLDSDTEPIRPIATAKINVNPVKTDRIPEIPAGYQSNQKNIPSNAVLLHKANDLAGKAVAADINANLPINQMAELPIVVANAFTKSNFPGAAPKKTSKSPVAVRAKSIAKLVLPTKLKATPEETRILEKFQTAYPKLDRRQLKRLMDNPRMYTKADGTVNMEKLLNDMEGIKEFRNVFSREKSPKDNKRLSNSASGKTGPSSAPRKKLGSKNQQPAQKNKNIKRY